MRILFNALQAGNRSGTGRYVAELARRLPGRCGDGEVVVLWPRHVPPPPLDDAAMRSLHPLDVEAPWRRLYTDQLGIRALRRATHADVVLYPANVGPLFELPNAVITIHDLTYFREPAWFRWERAAYYRAAVARSARRAKRLIADSQSTARDIQEFLGIPRDRIDVVPLGVGEEFQPAPPEAQAAVRARYALPERFFLYVGTLEPRKNLVRLIEAWSRIARETPSDLVLAGRDGWKVEPIRAAAAASPFADRIHFPGYVADADLPALMSAAQVFVWPSLYEGFGLPPLDAMACGTPVVTSNTSSLPEVAGDAALLVDPADVEAIAVALRDASANPGLRDSLRAKGLARAQQFTWDETARLTLDTCRVAAK